MPQRVHAGAAGGLERACAVVILPPSSRARLARGPLRRTAFRLWGRLTAVFERCFIKVFFAPFSLSVRIRHSQSTQWAWSCTRDPPHAPLWLRFGDQISSSAFVLLVQAPQAPCS